MMKSGQWEGCWEKGGTDDGLLWGRWQILDPLSEPVTPQLPVGLSVGYPLSETVTATLN